MKILIVHATAGAGHKRAAEALYQGFKEKTGDQVFIVDVLDCTNPFYKKSYQNVYTFLITKLSWAWGFFFALADLPFLRPVVRVLRRFVNHLNAKPFEQFLKNEQFDFIFSAHFFSNEVAAFMKRQGAIQSKIISVVTDFDVHSMWLAEGIDCYAAASDFTAKKLVSLGIEENKILVSGIPTDKKFTLPYNRDDLQNKFQLKKNLFTILVATGSFGIGPIKEIIAQLQEYQVLVVCGNNKNLFNELNQIKGVNHKVYGLVNNMDELMTVADAMITKPGGLSISEALIKGLPLIFFSAIPGQETGNVSVLKQCGIGISGRGVEEIIDEVKKLSGQKDYYEQAKQNTRQLAKPSAVSDIIQLASKLSSR